MLVTWIELKGRGAVYYLITTSRIRVLLIETASFRYLPVCAVVLIAMFFIVRRAEGAQEYSNKNNADGGDARAHYAHCDLDG
jgi:hypothetical protein